MKSATAARDFLIVLVTTPDLKTARKLAKAALAKKLIACANLVPRVESHYVWQGKVESSFETLMVMKTARRQLSKLEQVVLSGHPYDTPEFVALPVNHVALKYAAWWREGVRK